MTNTWSRVTQQLIARYFGAMACPHSQFLLRTKMFHFDTNPLPYVSCFIRWLRRAFHFHDASSANAQINYRAWGWSRKSTTYYGSGRPFWATVLIQCSSSLLHPVLQFQSSWSSAAVPVCLIHCSGSILPHLVFQFIYLIQYSSPEDFNFLIVYFCFCTIFFCKFHLFLNNH